MDIPARHVDTEWGALFATAPDPSRVRFSTETPDAGRTVEPLTIHRLQYSCYLELSLGPKGRGRVHVDDIWHFNPGEAITSLRRHPNGGPPTITAQAALQRHIVPNLVEWLYSPDGLALLQDSSEHRLRQRAETHGAAERLLQGALERVRCLEAPVVAGLRIDRADEEFLRYLTTDFRTAVANDTAAAIPDQALSPTPSIPQPPGSPGSLGL